MTQSAIKTQSSVEHTSTPDTMRPPHDTAQKATPPKSGKANRRHARSNVALSAQFSAEDGKSIDCMVKNISGGGALLETQSPPVKGSVVTLHIPNLEDFTGTVVRVCGHRFALDYRRSRRSHDRRVSVLIDNLASATDESNQQNAVTTSGDDRPHLLLDNGVRHQCSILDISLSGASLELTEALPIGAELTLGKMRARVVQQQENGVGIAFTGAATHRPF